MKKVLFFLSAILMLTLAACAGHDAEKVAQKIENGETLTQSDYKVMIDYIKDPIKETIKIMSEGMDNPEKAEKLADDFNKKYPYVQTFSITLSRDYNKLDESNQAAMEKLNNELMDL